MFLSLSSTVVSEGYFILETVSEHLISHHYSEFPSVPKPSRRKQICVQYSLVCDRLCPSSPLCSSGGSGTCWWSMKLTDWRTRIHCCTKPWAKWAALIWSKSVFLHIFNGLHSFFTGFCAVFSRFQSSADGDAHPEQLAGALLPAELHSAQHLCGRGHRRLLEHLLQCAKSAHSRYDNLWRLL